MSLGKNLEMAWGQVKRNAGAAGMDGQTMEAFEVQLDGPLERLDQELRNQPDEPPPDRQRLISKAGQPGQFRPLGLPTIYARVCQAALLNRLEPIFAAVFEDASFGYRRGRSRKEAVRKIWKELAEGNEWGVDADWKNFFGTVDQDKLLT